VKLFLEIQLVYNLTTLDQWRNQRGWWQEGTFAPGRSVLGAPKWCQNVA